MSKVLQAIQERFIGIFQTGGDQFVDWVKEIIPVVLMLLVLLNAVTYLVGRERIEKLARKCGSNVVSRYLILPFLSAVILGNPMAISMGRYLPEKYKPAYYASATYHCHTNSGLFPHINPAEMFLWLGIANGVANLGLSTFPLAVRYMLAGLAANFVSGISAQILTEAVAKKQGIKLSDKVALNQEDITESPAGEAENEMPEPESTDSSDAGFHKIRIERGAGGYGGPLEIQPTAERHTVVYMTGGGVIPEPLDKILRLSGMTAVNGFTDACPDEETALAIIDCGGTLRCGIYPKKGIPTVNILPTGKSGPLAKYIEPDIYVSAVTSAQISLAEDGPDSPADPADQNTHTGGKAAVGMSRIVSCFYQAARDAIKTCLEMLLPFMAFAALFVGIVKGSGLSELLARLLLPLPQSNSAVGFLILGLICSIPGLSAVLGAGAVAAQIFAAFIGGYIGDGVLSPSLALIALFAINCQCACDFIPVGLSLEEADRETVQVGITAVTYSRFLTGWIRILIAMLFSIGLY